MNDPRKCIDVNLSSLMSLKAELLRKRDEVSKSKITRSAETFVPKKSSKSDKKPKMEETVNSSDGAKQFEYEDSALLEKSQKVLAAKSKFYNKMTSLGGNLNSDDNCLVLFNQKKQDTKPEVLDMNGNSDRSSDDDSESDSEDEQWVEFTDCLGRTRKCLKNDLELMMTRDRELSANMPERLDMSAPNWMIDTKGSHPVEENSAPEEKSIFDDASMISKHDEMRINWERKEAENIHKENIHYQDVFFNEARQHGVGYYAFSTDDVERAKQQKTLDEMRKKTLAEQAEKEAQRATRERIIAERVRAAKNRQRARLGLPPLEIEPDESMEENPTETREERKRKKREKKKKAKKEKEEQQREEERKNHIRPWDAEKVEVAGPSGEPQSEWSYTPDKTPMSQEQWNEKKRIERNAEFAPVPEKAPKRSFEHRYPATQPQDMQPPSTDPYNFVSFQSSKPQGFQRRNYVPSSEYENSEFESNHQERGACIPPPASLNSNPFKTKRVPTENLESSIEAGLKFLRNNSDKGTLSTKSKWSSNADY